MRDKRKSADYFKSYIEYQTERINKKSDKLSSSVGDKAKQDRINQSLLRYKEDMLYAQFSAGSDRNDLIKYYEDAVKTAAVMDKLDYETLLNLLSFSIMLSVRNVTVVLIEKHNKTIQNDKLLNCLATYIKRGSVLWKGKFVIDNLYDKLNNIAISRNKEEVLFSYLGGWYKAHRDFAWYNSDMNDRNTYVGYWSYESAALARVLSINDRKLRKSEYYPVL